MNHETKQDYLSSYIREYRRLNPDEELFFVTVQPQHLIWEESQANKYINDLFPNCSYVKQLENNFEQHYHKAKLGQGLHMHLIVAARYLTHLPQTIYYKNNKHLNEIKHKLNNKNLHIVARSLFNDDLPIYLRKQDNNLLPQLCLRKISTSYPLKKKVSQPSQILNFFYLLQKLLFQTTYSCLDLVNKGKKLKERRMRYLHQRRILHCREKPLFMVLKTIISKNRYVPYLPNAPNNEKLNYLFTCIKSCKQLTSANASNSNIGMRVCTGSLMFTSLALTTLTIHLFVLMKLTWVGNCLPWNLCLKLP